MPKFSVAKTIHIAAPAAEVFAEVRDLRRWAAWSPWVLAEPDCALTYADDGTSYRWDGHIIGSGELAVIGEDAGRSIDYSLDFFKPWKSHADTRFLLAPNGGGTDVTWTLDSSLPFFLFPFTKMFSALIGMDYDRGLKRLKDQIETGSVPSRLRFDGIDQFPGCDYLGVRSTSTIDDIGPTMQRDLERVRSAMAAASIEPAGPPVSVYHKFSPAKGTTDYSIGFPIAPTAPPEPIPAGLVAGRIPATPVYKITHTGAYRHLGNAWAAGMMHARAKVFAGARKPPPFEICANTPDDTPEAELVTVVHLPAKG